VKRHGYGVEFGSKNHRHRCKALCEPVAIGGICSGELICLMSKHTHTPDTKLRWHGRLGSHGKITREEPSPAKASSITVCQDTPPEQ
jgi:hypothetical protein